MDIALVYDPSALAFDLAIEGGDMVTDQGLITATIVSFYTDRRALPEDELPDGGDDRRGWWADAYNDRPAGSRLWLLSREKELDSVLRRAKEYAEEALAWMVEDRVAAAVEVEAERYRPGTLLLRTAIIRGDGSVLERNYEYVWQPAA